MKKKISIFLILIKIDENIHKYNQKHLTMLKQQDICIVSDVHFAELCFFKGFLVFEIRKNFDLRKIFVTPKIFLKSKFHCTFLHPTAHREYFQLPDLGNYSF